MINAIKIALHAQYMTHKNLIIWIGNILLILAFGYMGLMLGYIGYQVSGG